MKLTEQELSLIIKEETELLLVESFLDKIKEKMPSKEQVKEFFDQLGRTFKKINKGRLILKKLSKEEGITKEENELLMTAIRDMAKIIPMAALIIIPGSPITIPFVVKLAKKYNIDIFPSEFSPSPEEEESSNPYGIRNIKITDPDGREYHSKSSFKMSESRLKKIIQEEKSIILFEDLDKEIEKNINEGIISASALAALASKAAALPLGIGMPIATALGPIVTMLTILSYAYIAAKATGAGIVVYALYRFIKNIYSKVMDKRPPEEKEIDRILSNLKNKKDREKMAKIIKDYLSDDNKKEIFGQEATNLFGNIRDYFKKQDNNPED